MTTIHSILAAFEDAEQAHILSHPDIVLHYTIQGVVLTGPDDVEVVAPAGDLQAVVAPFAREAGDFLEGQVCPLAGEKRDRSRHRGVLSSVLGIA